MYIHEQNITRLLHVLAKFIFSTCELELDYYHKKVNRGVVSQVAERLSTYDLKKLGNFKIIPGKLAIHAKSTAGHRKAKFRHCVKKLQKICCKTFQRNTSFT